MTEPYTSTHIVHITDTTDRNAELKVRSAYTRAKGLIGLKDADTDFAPALNTLDIGIVTSELIHNTQRPDRLILAVNCAPPDKKEGTQDNARNDFFCADLGDETHVCGTSNGYEFSYVKDQIKDLYRLTNTNSLKSQFRSLEILPEHTLLFSDTIRRAGLIAENILQRVEDVDSIIPSVPEITHVFEIDNFQNVKLFPSIKDLDFLRTKEEETISFQFGQASIETGGERSFGRRQSAKSALVAPTLFVPSLGTNVLALRSSSRAATCHIPIIATVRERPAETNPAYKKPKLGAPVRLWQPPVLTAA